MRLEFTTVILDSLLRGGLEDWADSPTGFKEARTTRYVDDIYLQPEKLYPRTEFEEKQRKLNNIRHKSVKEHGGYFHYNIREVFSKTSFVR